MGRPAARFGDLVTHIAPPVLGPGPGSSNVWIGGKPAWRGIPVGGSLPEKPPEPEPEPKDSDEELTEEEQEQAEKDAAAAYEAEATEMMMAAGGGADIHICAQPSPVPFCVDGPGFVINGSTTVLINGLPACRQGDQVQEILGPPNPIAMGCPTVIIGG